MKPIAISILGLALAPLFVAGCSTTASDVRSSDKPALHNQDMGAMQLPPGWTEADMQACMAAGIPGKMQEHLAQSVGTWTGTSTMWMAPGAPAVTSPANATITLEMDGRYTKCEHNGEMPGMGPFHGIGWYGYDNVAQKFVSTWLDNHSSGIMYGSGTLSSDGKTITWSYDYTDPVTKKPATMREIERWTGSDSMMLEMHGNDPKSGQEYKMMQIEMKRKPGTGPRG